VIGLHSSDFFLTFSSVVYFILREIVKEGVGQWLSYRKSTESLETLNELIRLNKLNEVGEVAGCVYK
jgi:hypothetical protein